MVVFLFLLLFLLYSQSQIANYICSPNVAAQMWYSGCLNQEPPGHLRCNLRWQSPLSSLPVNPTPISQLSKSKQHFVRVPTASLFTQIVLTGSAMDERGKGGNTTVQHCYIIRQTMFDPAVIETIRQGENFHQLQSITLRALYSY